MHPTHHVADGLPTSGLLLLLVVTSEVLLLLLMSHTVVAFETYPPGAACLPLRSGALNGAWVCF